MEGCIQVLLSIVSHFSTADDLIARQKIRGECFLCISIHLGFKNFAFPVLVHIGCCVFHLAVFRRCSCSKKPYYKGCYHADFFHHIVLLLCCADDYLFRELFNPLYNNRRIDWTFVSHFEEFCRLDLLLRRCAVSQTKDCTFLKYSFSAFSVSLQSLRERYGSLAPVLL